MTHIVQTGGEKRSAAADSLRNSLRWLDTHLLDRESRFRWLDALYMLFALSMLLHHIYVTLFLPADGYPVFKTAWIFFAVISLLMGKMWKNTGTWILFLIWLLCWLRLAVFSPELLPFGTPALTSGVYAAGGVFSVGCVLRKEDQKRFLQVFSILWTGFAFLLSALGIYSAYTGISIQNLYASFIAVFDGRLHLFYYCVTSGTFVSLSAVVALWACLLFRRRWIKVLLILAAAFMMVANALTGTRTGYLISASGISCLLCAWINHRFGIARNLQKTGKKAVGRIVLLLLVFFLLTGILTYAQTFLIDGFTSLRNQGGVFLPRALAEETALSLPDISHRDFSQVDDLDGLSSGRLSIWRAVFTDLLSHPTTLLLGHSLVEPMKEIYPANWHCHSLPLQITLECGLPGLILALLLISWIIRRHLHTLWRSDSSWQRMIFVPVIAILIGELIECTTIWEYHLPQMTLLYLFSGFTGALGRQAAGQRNSALFTLRRKRKDS